MRQALRDAQDRALAGDDPGDIVVLWSDSSAIGGDSSGFAVKGQILTVSAAPPPMPMRSRSPPRTLTTKTPAR